MAPFWVRDEHLEREADFPELRGETANLAGECFYALGALRPDECNGDVRGVPIGPTSARFGGSVRSQTSARATGGAPGGCSSMRLFRKGEDGG
jgi:hypothetical protein